MNKSKITAPIKLELNVKEKKMNQTKVTPTEGKKTMKRKTLTAILALTMACMLALTGCFPGLPGASQKTPLMDASVERVFTIGSYGGKKLLVINLNVTNNTDYNMTALTVQMYAQASLNGASLATSYLSDSSPEAISWGNSISPGSTGLGQLVFELPSTEGVVDLIITVDALDYSDMIVILEDSFDLAGVEAIVSESEFDVKVTNAVVTDDGEGTDVLVVYITFTNNSDSATSFSYSIGTEFFQNGIALKTTWLPYRHPLIDNDLTSNRSTDIKTGSSIDLMLVFSLYDNKNPVEIQLIDRTTIDNVVLLETSIDVSGS